VEILAILVLAAIVVVVGLVLLVLLGQAEDREEPGEWVHPARRGQPDLKDRPDPKARPVTMAEAMAHHQGLKTQTRDTGTSPVEGKTPTTPAKAVDPKGRINRLDEPE
jgi:hypothetical protein